VSERVQCPNCGKIRPSESDYAAGEDAWLAASIAYGRCCNPVCRGRWGIGCCHCHHPMYFTPEAQLTLVFVALGYADPRATARAIVGLAQRRQGQR
jgi:hypothetical protein